MIADLKNATTTKFRCIAGTLQLSYMVMGVVDLNGRVVTMPYRVNPPRGPVYQLYKLAA